MSSLLNANATLSTELQDFVRQKFDQIWNRPVSGGVLDDNARAQITQNFGYTLRMYWLGRTDKLSPQDLPFLAELTQSLIPEATLALGPGKPYVRPGRLEVLFAEADHRALEHAAMQTLVEGYVQLEGLAPVKCPTFWQRLRR